MLSNYLIHLLPHSLLVFNCSFPMSWLFLRIRKEWCSRLPWAITISTYFVKFFVPLDCLSFHQNLGALFFCLIEVTSVVSTVPGPQEALDYDSF